MKKNFSFLLIIIFICVCLVGCGTKKETEKHGNSFEISLYENASSGYSWSYDTNNDDIISISQSYDDSACEPNSDGCGGQRIYTVKALKPGKVTLNLEYAYFVDPKETTYNKTAVYEIVVDDDLNITESHYGTYFEENK